MNTTLNGDLRVSDADRDRALAELSEHFQAGRLDGDEFEERSGRALRARTARELTDLFVDLPRDRAQAPVPASAGTGGGVMPAQHSRGPGVLAAVVAVSLIAFVADVVFGHHGYGGFGPVGFGGPGVGIVVVLVVVARLTRRHRGRE